jgi:DNA polymerase III epsilon subunit-like protein
VIGDQSPSPRDRRMLWRDLRLLVLDIETVWDPGGFSGDAREEVDRAIAEVRRTGQPVRLSPQPRRVRWQQHATVEAAGMASQSHGTEPDRAVEVSLRAGSPPLPTPAEPALRGESRVASTALVECRRGQPGTTWGSLVNPGVPVDAETAKLHKLTDDKLRDQPSFTQLADEIEALLTPRENERLVLVGHNLGFDLGVLRAEMRRIGRELPDLDTLDTMGGLAARNGYRAGLGLLDLLDALGLPRPARRHDAAEDARATAAAACLLLDLCADQGASDLDGLLAEVGQRVSTMPAVRIGTRASKPTRVARVIEPAHAGRHAPLPVAPEQWALADWLATTEECARLRCTELAGDLSTSVVALSLALVPPTDEPKELLDALVGVAERRAAAGDGPGAASVMDAVGLIYDLRCPVPFPGQRVFYSMTRATTISVWHRLRALLPTLPCCGSGDGCPRCWEGQSCGRDELVFRLAPGMRHARWNADHIETDYSLAHWLPTDKRQGWFSHRLSRGRLGGSVKGAFAGAELADAATGWLLRAFWTYGDTPDRERVVAYQLRRVVRTGGCADPAFWEMVALDTARQGREADLTEAIAYAEVGLGARPAETTATAWRSLEITRDLLVLRRARVQRGHAVRHHPGPAAARPRRLRFALTNN